MAHTFIAPPGAIVLMRSTITNSMVALVVSCAPATVSRVQPAPPALTPPACTAEVARCRPCASEAAIATLPEAPPATTPGPRVGPSHEPPAHELPVPEGYRRVRFAVYPGGANLFVDGRPIRWFGATHALALGAHRLDAAMREGDDDCCQSVTRALTVPPGDDTLVVAVMLPIRPARVALRGAPANGMLSCENGLVSNLHAPGEMQLDGVSWTGRCYFLPGGAETRVTLFSGRVVVVDWPQRFED